MVLNGGFKSKPKLVFAHEEDGIDWLNRSVAGRLLSFYDVTSLQNLFISNKLWDAHIRSLGGLNVLITFESKELMEDSLRIRTIASLSGSPDQLKFGSTKGLNHLGYVECLFSLIIWIALTKLYMSRLRTTKVFRLKLLKTSWKYWIVTNIKVKRGMEEDDESPLRSEDDSVAIAEKKDDDFTDANITVVHDGFSQVHDSLIPRDSLVPVSVGQVALNEEGLRASQVKGIDLIVDLSPKEGSWRTLSLGVISTNYQEGTNLRRLASQIQSLKGGPI
ncbi:hypothetical protein RHSIM_Rhsim06G0189900 [Rhododendron simsii]|uniref:Uncharacterized protein n=1 Tax=Rhododendron simsii TaxID=118357 RepID=A0A834LI01_RHOSS|nr:hypothetical protein RHSIM_Rhsim06G0189900 [Rhododendron simsii]